jgi:hypothetical protein
VPRKQVFGAFSNVDILSTFATAAQKLGGKDDAPPIAIAAAASASPG